MSQGLTFGKMSRSHPEEPGTGADRDAKETSWAGEVLPGFLCCPEGVFTEASGAQTSQSHAGKTPAPPQRRTHVAKTFRNHFTCVSFSSRRWLTQTSLPRRSSESTRTRLKPRRGRSSSYGLDIKPRSSGVTPSKTWPWCSET